MSDLLVPPFVPVLLAAILLPFVGRRFGHALGFLATGAVVPYVWLVDTGPHLPFRAFGYFDVVLFNVDPFSRLMGLIFGFIGAMAVLYSWASDADAVQTAFALGYVGTSLGAVFGGDWLTLLFFWELMAVASTLLVWHYGGRAVRSGFRYALAHGIGGTLLLGAVVWHYAEAGTFLFGSLAGTPHAAGMAGAVAPVLAAVGIGVNVGFVGLHTWLPDTYPAPHVAASVFLCVYTTKTGVYGMYRAFPADGHIAIAYMGGAMAAFGAGMALMQDDMRRLLSYHIQSQVGYMIAGVGIGTTLATNGAFAHVFNHILYKGLLFMTVGVVIYRTGQERLSNVGGLARKMPITAAAFFVAALSIAGFPGFNGFVSKGMVITAAHKEHVDLLWYLLLAGGVGTFLSFIKLGYHAFLHGEYDGPVEDANDGQALAMVLVAALCVLYGLYHPALYSLLPLPVEFDAFSLTHLAEGFALAIAGVLGFAALERPLKLIGRIPDVDRLLNPATFYGTRWLVVGVTELFDAVDRAVVRVSSATVATVSNPEDVAGSALGRDDIDLRAGIGTSVLLVTVALTLALVVVL